MFYRVSEKACGQPFIYQDELLEPFEKAITDTIRCNSSDILSTFVDVVDAAQVLPAYIAYALQTAVLEEFEDNTSRISGDDSESSLSDRIGALKRFAPRFGVPAAVLNSAVSPIEDRIGEIEDQSSPAPSPSFLSSNKREGETFDDFALRAFSFLS